MSETQKPKGPVERRVRPFGDAEMEPAWGACVAWAMGIDELREQFKHDTGHDLDSLHGSAVEQMIDEATGRTREIMAAWCDWVTENIWGTA